MKIFQNRNFHLPAPSCIDDVVDDVVFVMVTYLCFYSLFDWTKWFQISNKLRKMCAKCSIKFFSYNLFKS
ncbi:hypothetical protein PFMALIP_05756 [Plasmodium falciparum MaliPS096_E11]|uniref:Uncharacterized protein n=1 Tax=Plasmodium falciparum MaliPS096_E11 TaxID=1036727 RepID=A0A024WG56_PLAFA|nr:hypothetical protein PFMALIP_05756 [Plasmodium falciparum MaliPS096_E11]